MSALLMDSDGAARTAGPLPRSETPIVPRNSIAGRALVAVVAIMTLLASLTAGAVMQIRAAAADWQASVVREITVQVRPTRDRDHDADVQRVVEIARAQPSIAQVRAYGREEAARLLEPWLGTGLSLDGLPLPRLVVVRFAAGTTPDLAPLRKALAAVPGASLDDHRAWVDRMRAMSRAAVIGGIVVLVLMLAATMLSVAFATRGAMASNRTIVEVLHFVGAKDSYIASQFQRHFLVLGLEGGAIGGGIAIVVFVLFGWIAGLGRGTAGHDQFAAMFGSIGIGASAYAAVLAQIVLVAAVTTLASRATVKRTLAGVE